MSSNNLNNGNKVYIAAGRRTPFGSFGGKLKEITPVDLSLACSKALLDDLSLEAEQIDHVIFSNVLPSTPDTLYGGRHLSLKLGCPQVVPAYSVNRLCGSGIQAVWDAFSQIKMGRSNCVLVSGSENMSMVPHLTYGARFGIKYGPLKSKDLLFDTLTDELTNTPMGITAENLASDYKISRQECEEFSLTSHHRALKARKDKKLESELITTLEIKSDSHIRENIDLDSMKKLKPSFVKGGVVTPATASGIVDGAASSLIVSSAFAENNKLNCISEIIDFSVVGVDPTRMGIGPVPAIRELLKNNNMEIKDIDLFEINEAFASQVLSCAKELSIDIEKLNIWGGAIAIGHPLGATGIRLLNTLAYQLKDKSLKYGIASACIGGGQGIAILVKNCDE